MDNKYSQANRLFTLIGYPLLILGLSLMWVQSSLAQSTDNLYQITLLRAAPGNLQPLLNQTRAQKASYQDGMIIMRHSQGDHWDLMLVRPSANAIPKVHDYSPLVHFQHDFLATAPEDWAELQKRSEGVNLFHIEMFHATAGRKAELLRQREMENLYYHATERAGNVIFTTRFGSDVDFFTVGFYRDMKHFASDPDLPEAQFEKAATDAGFASRDSIGLYLRELIISHHDTLATQVE